MKSVPLVRFARPRPAALNVDAGDVQRRLAGFVERQLELIAAEQVDAVERRVLRRGGDLGQDAVELVHQVAANGLRRRVDHRSRRGRERDRRRSACRRSRRLPPTEPRVDEA